MHDDPFNPSSQGNLYPDRPAKYCSACGAGLVSQAVICPNCGSPTGTAFSSKSKTAAVLLAVFLGPWTWLYTYRRNAWKFWVGLASGLLGTLVGVLVAGAVAGTATGTGPYGAFPYQPPSSSLPAATIFFVVFGWLLPFGVWIWAIIDTATTPSPFFTNYPNV